MRDELRKRAREHYNFLLQRSYINCWHINTDENNLMWAQYVPSRMGVAIRSTVTKLGNAMCNNSTEVYWAPVDYVDHSSEPLRTDRLPGGMSQIVFDMLTKKRRGFSGEQELRLITDTLSFNEKWAPNLVGSHLDTSIQNSSESTNVALDLSALIDVIVLLPNSSSELRSDVERILRDSSLNVQVVNSALS